MLKKTLFLSGALILFSIFLINVVSADMNYAASANGGVASVVVVSGSVEGGSVIGNVNDENDATDYGVYDTDLTCWAIFTADIIFSQTAPEITQIDYNTFLQEGGIDEEYEICQIYVRQDGVWNNVGGCWPSSPGSLTGNWQNVEGVRAYLETRAQTIPQAGDCTSIARLFELKAFGEEKIPELICGNLVLETGEECDDGNLIDGDGCSSICEIEEPEPICSFDLNCGTPYCAGGSNYCGLDGNVYQDFVIPTCNNPGQVDAYCTFPIAPQKLDPACEYGCENGECIDEPPEPPVCGENGLEEGEECDDGNLIDGDGCSSECEIETPEPPEECCNDEDCSEDYYEDKYCVEDDVYKDFHDFSCVDDECVENILEELVKWCEFGCEDGECLEEEEDDKKKVSNNDGDDCNWRYEDCEGYDEEILGFYDGSRLKDYGVDDVILIEQSSLIGQSDKGVGNNLWVVYLFFGVLGLLVLILIILGVRK